MSLVSPHLVWSSAVYSSRKVTMVTIQAIMLSGRYRCGALLRHWSADNTGICQLSSRCRECIEDLPHILSSCYALENVRNDLVQFTHNYADELSTELKSLILGKCIPDSNSFTLFIVDCSTDTKVITLTQDLGDQVLYHAFSITRTWPLAKL